MRGLATGRPRRVLAVAAVAFLVAAVFGLPAAGLLTSRTEDFQDPGSQYEQVNRDISKATGQTPYYNVAVLVAAKAGIASSPRALRATSTLSGLLAGRPGFQRSLDYTSTHLRRLLSRDGKQTVVLAAYGSPAQARAAVSNLRSRLRKPAMRAKMAGIRVRFGGIAMIADELTKLTITDLERAELLALPIVLLLSFWFFRGIVAALLPPLVGGFSILITFLALRLIDQVTPVSIFALNLASGMGLGLGIDYSMFIVYRYREELAGGATRSDAIATTMQTAGRTVLFSSLTVAASLTCLLVFPIRFLYSMGIGGALVALCDGAVALLVLPSLLMVIGRHIDSLSPSWLTGIAARSATATAGGGWWRLAHAVMRRPAIVATLSAAALLAAAVPVGHLAFAPPGANLLPVSSESRQVESALAADFSVNLAESGEIVVHGPLTSARALAHEVAAASGDLATVSPPTPLASSPSARVWQITTFPHGSPFTAAQARLLGKVRSIAASHGALVGGATAYFADQKASINSHIVPAVAILASLTVLFLFAMTGSVAIPVKAVAMSLLTISVGAGLLVAIFQDGNLSGLLSFTPIGGLEESTLVLTFVLAFALSIDYEVFVLARIKEAHDSGLPNREAIALGVERTGRIITAAALLFCVAIGALAISKLFFTKQLGVGSALAVAIDAAIVRALLVPSLMALMGRWNWWAPAPLRRLHDRLGLAESGAAVEEVADTRRLG